MVVWLVSWLVCTSMLVTSTSAVVRDAAYWEYNAIFQGKFICPVEIVEGSDIQFPRVWARGEYCGTPTIVKYACCEGYEEMDGMHGCPRVVPLKTLTDSLLDVGAHAYYDGCRQSGVDRILSIQGAFTLLAPENQAFRALPSSAYHPRASTQYGSGPANLFYHLLEKRIRFQDLEQGMELETLYNQQPIRINKFSAGLVTANCVPFSRVNLEAKNGLVHTLRGALQPISPETLADFIVRDHHNLRRFSAALVQEDLNSLLREDGPFTVFAPTDSAFAEMDQGYLQNILYDKPALKALLKYHIVAGVHCSSSIIGDTPYHTLEGSAATATCDGDTRSINGGRLVKRDIMTNNGVLHYIDKIMVPRRAKPILQILEEMKLSRQVSLLKSSSVQQVLETQAPITLLIPTNKALASLPKETQERLVKDPHFAKGVFLGHTIPGRHLTSALMDRQILQSRVGGRNLRVKLYRRAITINEAKIVRSDIEGSNGVVHLIDRVLLSPSQTILQYLQTTGNFSKFLTALNETDTNLIEPLGSSSGPYTVFAPKNGGIDWWASDLFTFRRMLREQPIVSQIMNNHLVEGSIISNALLPEAVYEFRDLNNRPILVRKMAGGEVFAGIAHVIQPDIICTNGVIHVVNRLIQRY